MRLRELVPWPPTLTDSRTNQIVSGETQPARLRRCGVFTAAGSLEAYLSVVVELQGHSWHAMIHGIPELLMWRIEATLAGHQGRTLVELGDLEVVDNIDRSTLPFAYKPRPEPPPPRA